MFPVKPSQTTTSAGPSRRSRLSTLPTKRRPLACEQRERLAGEPVPLLRLLADREQRTSGLSMSSTSWAKTAPMCANWSRCSGRASAFAPASIRTDGPRLRGERHGDRGPVDGREPADLERGPRRASRRCSRPRRRRRRRPRRRRGRRRTASCRASRGRRRRASRPSSTIVGAWTISRPSASGSSSSAARRGRLDRVERASSAPCDHDLRRPVAAHGVDGDPHAPSQPTGRVCRGGSTSRPRYVPQVGQTWCGRFG